MGVNKGIERKRSVMDEKQSAEKEYVEGLECFLEASHEDSVNIDGLLEQLPHFADATLARLKERGSGLVLDIGAGNGAKASYLARRLEKLGVRVLVHSIEPKAEQRARIEQHYQGENRRFFGAVQPLPLEEAPDHERYDLILLIHSLYEFPMASDGIIPSLAALRKLIAENGVASIIIEHPDGDFQRMKREFYPSLGKNFPVSLQTVERTLASFGFPYAVGNPIDFSFDMTAVIDRTDAEIGHVLSFLFSDSLNAEPLRQKDLEHIGSWARANARKTRDGRCALWTPDIVIWVQSKPESELSGA